MMKLPLAIICLMLSAHSAHAWQYNPQIPIEIDMRHIVNPTPPPPPSLFNPGTSPQIPCGIRDIYGNPQC